MPKLDQLAPSNPIASSITTSSIKWTSDIGSLIVCNGQTKPSGSTWFNLTPNSGYIAYAYLAEDDTYNESPHSEDITATTLNDKIGVTVRSNKTGLVMKAQRLPVASNVSIENIDGSWRIGARMRGSYAYYEYSGVVENESIIIWYRSDTPTGPWVPVKTSYGEVGDIFEYILDENDYEKYLKLGVTPRNGTDPRSYINTGEEVFSDPTPQIMNAETPPEARNVKIQKVVDGFYEDIDPMEEIHVGTRLYGYYDFFDINLDPKGICIHRWYRSLTEDIDGEYEVILGIDGNPYPDQEYVTRDEDYRKHLYFEVTPISL
jgi:hypothetical protein